MFGQYQSQLREGWHSLRAIPGKRGDIGNWADAPRLASCHSKIGYQPTVPDVALPQTFPTHPRLDERWGDGVMEAAEVEEGEG